MYTLTAHTHKHPQTHTCIHSEHIYTHIYTLTVLTRETYTYAHDTQIDTCIHSQHTHMYILIAHIYTLTEHTERYTQTHMCVHSQHTHTHLYIRTSTHSTHTHTHTHTHTKIHPSQEHQLLPRPSHSTGFCDEITYTS